MAFVVYHMLYSGLGMEFVVILIVSGMECGIVSLNFHSPDLRLLSFLYVDKYGILEFYLLFWFYKVYKIWNLNI